MVKNKRLERHLLFSPLVQVPLLIILMRKSKHLKITLIITYIKYTCVYSHREHSSGRH